MSAPTVAELAAIIRELRSLWRDHIEHAPSCPLTRAEGPCRCRVGKVADRADEALRRLA